MRKERGATYRAVLWEMPILSWGLEIFWWCGEIGVGQWEWEFDLLGIS